MCVSVILSFFFLICSDLIRTPNVVIRKSFAYFECINITCLHYVNVLRAYFVGSHKKFTKSRVNIAKRIYNTHRFDLNMSNVNWSKNMSPAVNSISSEITLSKI